MLALVAVLWGVTGISLVFGSAIYRLGLISLEIFSHPLQWYHWAALLFSVVFMGFAEGYRGFQQGYSPRVAARLLYLKHNVTPLRLLLAPLFCMGFFDIKKSRMIISYCLLVGILILVQLVHLLEQPWRGIVDGGVVVGLTWGSISIVLFILKAFFTDRFEHSPEMPEASN